LIFVATNGRFLLSGTLLVIRDLFQGKQRFDEFISSPEGIATNILTHHGMASVADSVD
jgi:hypothetical protein